MFEDWAVAEFVNDPDLDVRRGLVTRLPNARERQPALVAAAIQIARGHEDEYIRARLRADRGESALLPCKPMPTRRHEES